MFESGPVYSQSQLRIYLIPLPFHPSQHLNLSLCNVHIRYLKNTEVVDTEI